MCLLPSASRQASGEHHDVKTQRQEVPSDAVSHYSNQVDTNPLQIGTKHETLPSL